MTRAQITDAVQVSEHAIEQLRKRDPEFARSVPNVTNAIYREVVHALAAGRKAAHKPRWVRQRGGPSPRRSEGVRAARYVWDPGQQRCYLLRRVGKSRLRNPTVRTWRVVTVYARRKEAT